MRNGRRALVAGLAATLLGAAATDAATSTVSLHVRPAIVSPGGLVHVYRNAGDCPVGDTVTVLSRPFAGRPFAGVGTVSARVRAGGAFSGTGRVRRHVRAGRYGVTGRCGGGNLGVLAHVRVR